MSENDLTPGACFPTQLKQAVGALQFILAAGYLPGNIIIGGDSAGGNLAFALSGHLIHPHPAIGRIELPSPVGGIFGISPWLNIEMHTISYAENSDIDMLSPSLVRQSGLDLFPAWEEDSRGWCLPLHSPSNLLGSLEKVVRGVYLNAGQHEMFRDHVLAFARMIDEMSGRKIDVVLDIGKIEAPDHIWWNS